MITKALRLYGKNDVRVEEFELPPIKDDEILAKVVCDSLCMSSYKAAIQGEDHKRVPNDIAQNPVMLGHEFAGEIVQVGKKWKDRYSAGDRFVIQPALNYKGTIDAPGYSFPYIGGCATYIIIPHQVMELGCLLPYASDTYFYGSLAEPYSCVIGSCKEMFHQLPSSHDHIMGVKENGHLAILAGAGPMGLAAIDYIIHTDVKPKQVIVTDIDQGRLDYAGSLLSIEEAKRQGVDLRYVNTANMKDQAQELRDLTGGHGFDDVLVMAPVAALVQAGDRMLATNGCMSFFSGPSKTDFEASINFYNIHYASTHFIGTVGGNSADMVEAIDMSLAGRLNPAILVTHIGGLEASGDATMNLPNIKGGKKLIYTHINMELTDIKDFAQKGVKDARYAKLAELVEKHNGLWNTEAENYLLQAFAAK